MSSNTTGLQELPPGGIWVSERKLWFSGDTRGGPIVRQSLDEIAKLPLECILVAHSDPVEDRPIEQLEEAWRFVR